MKLRFFVLLSIMVLGCYGLAGAQSLSLDHTDGLLYTYFNWYPDGAAELEPGRAIRFVPMPFLLADGSGTAIPVTLLHTSFPNPFAPLTTIRYDLARPGHVSLGIYDVRGRLVQSLVDSHRETGFHPVQWSGVDDHGRSAAPGLYFCRLVTRDGSWTRKMLLLRSWGIHRRDRTELHHEAAKSTKGK